MKAVFLLPGPEFPETRAGFLATQVLNGLPEVIPPPVQGERSREVGVVSSLPSAQRRWSCHSESFTAASLPAHAHALPCEHLSICGPRAAHGLRNSLP